MTRLYTIAIARAMPSPYVEVLTASTPEEVVTTLRLHGLYEGAGFADWCGAGELGGWTIRSASGLPVAVVVRS